MHDLPPGLRARYGVPAAKDERTVWLATAAYAGVVGAILLALGHGQWSDWNTMGGVLAVAQALLLIAYGFRRATQLRAAAAAGTRPPRSGSMLAILGCLAAATAVLAVVGVVAG
ncbi:MAG TPA: hypothetical protein VI248_06520 [Kineosporiaceae bacterium]